MYFHSGSLLTLAPDKVIAIEAPRIALAPRLDLLSVPSRAIIASSSARWLSGFLPLSSLAILVLTAVTAFVTPLPR
ncbi:MAG: hypothetical protein AW12_02615 [Candidatus Accumulibacter sp. BA-94]|nr:MAG: hypothetical protein AW12_02615 [Candidatus Accumulibacter sp. BA-94]